MVLTKEESIVADSTVSSSPSLTTRTVKRPTRTYGRPRDSSMVNVEHHRSSSSSSGPANSSSIYWTGPVGAQEEIPPSSDPPHSSPIDCQQYVNEGDDENSIPNASVGYEFSWRRDLREMDRDDDTDDGENSENGAETNILKSKLSATPEPLSLEQRESSDHEKSSPRRASMSPAPHLDDILGGSLTCAVVASSSQVPSNRESSPVQNRRRVPRRIEDENTQSGDEHEYLEDSSPTKPFPINTPERASSPTPPTSEDDEMPTTKEKGSRGSSSRKGAAPLRFEDEQSLPMKSGTIAAKVNRKDRRKLKAPTKKEQQEMQKERQRIKAEREVHIPQVESSKDVSLASWAQSYSIGKTLLQVPSNPKADPKSSPISEFSSPLPKDKRTQNTHPGFWEPKRNYSSRNVSLPNKAPSDDEDELPEIHSITANAQATFKPGSDEKRRGLHAKKLALARMNQGHATIGEIDDEDDLQIVDSVAPSLGQRDMKKLPQSHSIPTASTSTIKQNRVQSQPTAKGAKKTLTPGDVNKVLIQKVVVAGTSARNKKKEEWLRNGGTLLELKQDVGAPVESITQLVQRSIDKRRQVKDEAGDNEEEEEDSDEEWNPDLVAQYRGSASPDPEDAEIGEKIEGVVTSDPADISITDTVDNGEQDSPLKRPRNKRTMIQSIQSDSEEENDENISQIPARPSAVIEDEGVELPSVRRGSVSSFEGGTEDEYDKENDTRRMYDRSEDKENTAVVRHSTNVSPRPLLGSRQGSRFRLVEGLSSHLSTSPGNRNSSNDGETDEIGFKEPQRQPLQPLERTKSVLSSPDSFYDRLRQVEPDSVTSSSGEGPTSTLEPALNLIRPRPNANFSQFSDEESENVFAKPLQGGLSDLFESATQNSPSTSRNMKLGALKRLSLGLTQEVEGRPILAVDDQLKRKADDIFEKEQGWVVERAEEQYNQRPELYVNDAGLLTQTRPEGTPDVYRRLPTQVGPIARQSGQALTSHKRTLSEISMAPSTSTQRTPFRDISLAGLDFDGTLVESPSNRPRRRLTKKRDSASPSRDPAAPRSVSTALLDPFKHLKNKGVKERPALPQISEFVEAEAQESDEEGAFPFGIRKAGDEDEEGENEDLDKTLETLVDDRDMDEDTVNQEAVMEKFHEQTEEDDQKLEKMNQEVIQGEWRKKRRRGIGVDDSDEEDDDDYEQRKIRRKMHSDTLIDRQNIKELGNSAATNAFFESYKKGIQDDDDNNDLAYLAEGVPDVMMGDATVVEDEQEEPEKVVTTKELVNELRQAARNNEDEEESAFNPHDVSWADEADEELNVSVKMVSGRKVATLRGAGRQRDEHEFYAQTSSRFMENDQQRTNMQNWAKAEDRMRSRGGNGRSVASATITGHGKAKPKLASGGGSLRGGPSKDAGTGPTRTAKSLKAAPSFLKNPAMDRSSRFGQ